MSRKSDGECLRATLYNFCVTRATSAEPFVPRPQLGDWLIVDVGSEVQQGKFMAAAREWPRWDCLLQMRRGSPPPGAVQAWVFAVDVKHGTLRVSLDDFGRLPVSERMFARYEQALLGMIDVLQHDLSDFDPELCAEVKGMYSRTFKKDQVDWLSVYEVLGRPRVQFAREMAEQLRLLGRGLRVGDVEMAESAHRRLSEMGAVQEFGQALERLREEA